MSAGISQPGTYVISFDGEKTTLEADYLDHDAEGNLRVWKGGKVAATFRWWSSIVRKGD